MSVKTIISSSIFQQCHKIFFLVFISSFHLTIHIYIFPLLLIFSKTLKWDFFSITTSSYPAKIYLKGTNCGKFSNITNQIEEDAQRKNSSENNTSNSWHQLQIIWNDWTNKRRTHRLILRVHVWVDSMDAIDHIFKI